MYVYAEPIFLKEAGNLLLIHAVISRWSAIVIEPCIVLGLCASMGRVSTTSSLMQFTCLGKQGKCTDVIDRYWGGM